MGLIELGIGLIELGIGLRINQSPKGNMWSAIPVALLCMLVNEGDG